MKIKIGFLEYDCMSYGEEIIITKDGSLHNFKIMLYNPIADNHDDVLKKIAEIENELKKQSYNIIIINKNEEKTIYINNFYQIYYDDASYTLLFNMSI